MYRILIVEDERDEYLILRHHLERFASEQDVDFSISWLSTAFNFNESIGHYDLIFMDIEMPGINGMEAAQLLRETDPTTPLIFVTNLAQYAMMSYEVDALDFMVKPVPYGRFESHMRRAMRTLRANAGGSIVIPQRDGARVLRISSIIYIDVRGHELTFHLDDGDTFTTRGKLTDVEKATGNSSIIRVSKSCLVNINAIDSVKGPDIKLSTGETIALSRSMRKQVLNQITAYLGSVH